MGHPHLPKTAAPHQRTRRTAEPLARRRKARWSNLKRATSGHRAGTSDSPSGDHAGVTISRATSRPAPAKLDPPTGSHAISHGHVPLHQLAQSAFRRSSSPDCATPSGRRAEPAAARFVSLAIRRTGRLADNPGAAQGARWRPQPGTRLLRQAVRRSLLLSPVSAPGE